MKTRLLGVLLPVFFYLVFATTAVCGPSLTRAEIARLVAEAATYQPGQSCEAFRRIEEWVSRSVSDAATRQTLEGGLVQLLAPSATFEARRFACKQLGIIGGKDALPSLAKLLLSDETVGIACVALTTYPSGKADEAPAGARSLCASPTQPFAPHWLPRRKPPGFKSSSRWATGGIRNPSSCSLNWPETLTVPLPNPPLVLWAGSGTKLPRKR